MKNIPLKTLLEVAAGSNSVDTALDKLIVLSRLDEGVSTYYWSATEAYDEPFADVSKKISEWLYSRGYILSPGWMGGMIGLLTKPEARTVSACVGYSLMNASLTFRIYGDEAEMLAIKDWVKGNFRTEGFTIKTATHLDREGAIKFESRYLPMASIQKARQSFYPWLSISLEEYFQAFYDSSESTLVMFGPPGNGKSTFLRTLIAMKCRLAFLAYNQQVVESPALITRFYSSQATLLGYEDMDRFLKKREDGNQLMATLLNAADGVIKHPDKKIVFSTNLSSIDSIDPALLRVGRCFDILHFRNLTPDEADAVLLDVGKPARDFSTKKEWSLAEILSDTVPAQQTINRFAKRVGFM